MIASAAHPPDRYEGGPVATDDETLIKQARTLFDAGRLDEAADLYRRLIDGDPTTRRCPSASDGACTRQVG